MPSVTDTTVPCVRASAPISSVAIRLLMSSLISEGFSCMGLPRVVLLNAGWWPAVEWITRVSSAQPVGHGVELRLHRSVDHGIADGDARAANQRRLDFDAGLDL